MDEHVQESDEGEETTSDTEEAEAERESVRNERVDLSLGIAMRQVRRAQERMVIAAVSSIPEVKAKIDEIRVEAESLKQYIAG